MNSHPTRAPASSSADRRRSTSDLHRRALELWPRLDARALSRCGDDAACVARLVARRTPLSVAVIEGLLNRDEPVDPDEPSFWFG